MATSMGIDIHIHKHIYLCVVSWAAQINIKKYIASRHYCVCCEQNTIKRYVTVHYVNLLIYCTL